MVVIREVNFYQPGSLSNCLRMMMSLFLIVLMCICSFNKPSLQNEVRVTINSTSMLNETDGDYFHYFGFGSNLLADRIHIQNPTATRLAMGKLKNYRLDFYGFTKRWGGAPATVVPTNNSEVYGAIWKINLENLADLDKQEGVDTNMYTPISVPVETANGTIMCRAYYLTMQPSTILNEEQEVPFDRQPSATYLKTLVKGAIETKVPRSYLDWMKKIKHNGNLVEKFEKDLGLESVQLSS